MTNQELAKLAISNENTPELGQYWQKRYEKFLKNNVFILSEKTELLLEQKDQIDSPATPYGYLNLPVFLGKNKVVDEVMLQNCIETAVRFLDSILDVINFTPEARKLINQNRKIGLGILNFEEYFVNREATSKVKEIDYIGEIISSSSYRASEALAEEKGPCESWTNLAFIIRPKPFEYWYNSETGEVKSGLDIAEEYTSTNLLASHFEIIPRRNSHILLYPNDQEWQIWSDRDDNSIITSNSLNSKPLDNTNLISQEDDNDYTASLKQDTSKNDPENSIPLVNTSKFDFDNTKDVKRAANTKLSSDQFTNPPPIEDLPLINPISTLQQKISKWFAVEPNVENSTAKNSFDLSKNGEEIHKTYNDLPIPKPKEVMSKPEIITQIKEVEIIREVPVEVIREVEVIKEIPVEVIREVEHIKEVEVIREINKPILAQIVILSNEAKKILVDKSNQLPAVQYTFQKDIESEIIEKIHQEFGVDIDFMEISSINLFENQVYIVYQAKIQNLSENNLELHFDFVEALTKEQDTVAYSKSIDRVHRWQQSSKIKAQELLKEYNQNLQIQTNENESKIIVQKNSFIEDLQVRIQALINENQETENKKNQEILSLNNDLEGYRLKLKEVKKSSTPIETTVEPEQQKQSIEIPATIDDEVVLVKNDDLTFDLNTSHTSSNNQQSIPTININTNTAIMSQNQDTQSEIDANQITFRASRDKMFMPTLEIETKLGVPVIVHKTTNDNLIATDQPEVTDDTDPKSPSHAANVLLKLKRLTR
jgi:Ribonucleotide reductase, barrel domain